MTATILEFPVRGEYAVNNAGVEFPDRALDIALDMIRAAFASPEVWLKRRVRTLIKLGVGHHEFRARYGVRAIMLRRYSLDEALFTVERWYCVECMVIRRADKLGMTRSRMTINTLRELRLMLRLLRRSAEWREHYRALVEFTIGQPEVVEVLS